MCAKFGARREGPGRSLSKVSHHHHFHATTTRLDATATRRRLPGRGAELGGQNTQFFTARLRASVSPARLTGGATTRLRGREKFKSFPFSSEKSAEKFLLRALTHEECCKEGITSRLEKCGLPLKHCTKQRSGRKSVTSLLSRKSRRR